MKIPTKTLQSLERTPRQRQAPSREYTKKWLGVQPEQGEVTPWQRLKVEIGDIFYTIRKFSVGWSSEGVRLDTWRVIKFTNPINRAEVRRWERDASLKPKRFGNDGTLVEMPEHLFYRNVRVEHTSHGGEGGHICEIGAFSGRNRLVSIEMLQRWAYLGARERPIDIGSLRNPKDLMPDLVSMAESGVRYEEELNDDIIELFRDAKSMLEVLNQAREITSILEEDVRDAVRGL